MPRPLLSKSIDELEQLFSEKSGDLATLRILHAELQHRSRPRAQRLLDKVQGVLQRSPDPIATPARTPAAPAPNPARPAVQRQLGFETPPDSPLVEQTRPGPRRPRSTRSRSAAIRFVEDDFRLVRGRGATGCPQAYQPEAKTDVTFDFADSDSPAKRFSVVLEAHIEELRREDRSHERFPLENGQRVSIVDDEASYAFDFGDDPNVFEGADVSLIVGGREVAGRLTTVLAGRLIVTIEEDFGDSISFCTLRIDSTALLRALAERLKAVDGGKFPSFDAGRAARAINNQAETTSTSEARWPWQKTPTGNQRIFLRKAVGHDLLWLWGPPGTGKTETLSALVKVLFDSGDRVLICSNTHKAVDQLLQKICQNLLKTDRPTLEDGRIVRLGKVSDILQGELQDGHTYAHYLSPDLIVERKSKDLARRREVLLQELERSNREFESTAKILHLFSVADTCRTNLAAAEKSVDSARQVLERCEHTARGDNARLAELASELQEFDRAGSFRRFFMRDERGIRTDLSRFEARVRSHSDAIQAASDQFARAETLREDSAERLKAAELPVAGLDRTEYQRKSAEHSARTSSLNSELNDINRKLADIEEAVLRDARVLGATVTHVYLHAAKLGAFDTVIVDEASMILLPAVFYAAGLSRKRVVIAGDFMLDFPTFCGR